MQDASTRRKRFLRITQGFETSRLEKGLLAVAYERAVPVVTRRARTPIKRVVPTSRNRATGSFANTNVQPSVTKEGQQVA